MVVTSYQWLSVTGYCGYDWLAMVMTVGSAYHLISSLVTYGGWLLLVTCGLSYGCHWLPSCGHHWLSLATCYLWLSLVTYFGYHWVIIG